MDKVLLKEVLEFVNLVEQGCKSGRIKSQMFVVDDPNATDLKPSTLGAYAGQIATQLRVAASAKTAEQPTEQTMTLAEIWAAAGGNPGITPTRADVMLALKTLDEICDEADKAPEPRETTS